MKVNLHLYPTLTPSMIEQVGIGLSDLFFYYHRDKVVNGSIIQERREIKVEDEDTTPIELLDKKGIWDIAHDDLEIVQKIQIKNPKSLFGADGIASEESRLGLAVVWSSPESLQKGTEKILEFDNECDKIVEEIAINFTKRKVRSQLNYKVILYIAEPSQQCNSMFANEYGLIVGELFHETLILEGDVSTFPIVSIEDENAPLWSLYCMWSDLNSPFSESVRLRLNKSHSKYDLLNMESTKFNANLFNQILISVVVQIIITAKERNELDLVEEIEDFPIGSIGALIKYYLETYAINYSDISTVYSSINKSIWG